MSDAQKERLLDFWKHSIASFSCSSIAYIGPGLSYLAVHSCELIGLIHERWKDPKYLLGYPPMADEGEASANTGALLGPGFLWYVLGMPIWSTIALFGQQKLDEHFETEEMASPSIVKPKRISLVEPKWQHGQASARFTGLSFIGEQALLLEGTPQSTTYGTKSFMGGNRRPGELTPNEAQRELRNDIPTWFDFGIAIMYVIIGVVAMAYGLASVLL